MFGDKRKRQFSAFPHWVFLAVKGCKLPYLFSHVDLSHAHYFLQSKENIFSFSLGNVKDKASVAFSKPACLSGQPAHSTGSLFLPRRNEQNRAKGKEERCCRPHLAQLPRRVPGALQAEKTTPHMLEVREQSASLPTHGKRWEKLQEKMCPAFNSTAESCVSLQSHWERIPLWHCAGQNTSTQLLLEGCGFPFLLDPNYMFDSTCCLACQEVKIKPPFLCGLSFFFDLWKLYPWTAFSVIARFIFVLLYMNHIKIWGKKK